MKNPLDSNEQFSLGMMNPNPKSSKTAKGPIYRVSFELEQEDWQKFMDAKTSGMVLACVMQVVSDAQVPEAEPVKPEKGPYGLFAQRIIKSGVLRMPNVWAALGTEENHKEWIQKHACFVCGRSDYIENLGERRCEEAHIRRADNSGTAFKPKYISIPLCHDDHATQHQSGEAALFDKYKYCECQPGSQMSAEGFKVKLSSAAVQYTERWAKDMIYEIFEIDSLTWLEPSRFRSFLTDHGIQVLIPDKFDETTGENDE